MHRSRQRHVVRAVHPSTPVIQTYNTYHHARSVLEKRETLVSNTEHHQGNHKELKLIYSDPISNHQPCNTTIIQP